MAEKGPNKKKQISADWFVGGVLTKIGDTFDRLTGRGWKPSSSLATSELAERLKALVDAEARETDGKRKFVPHNIKLKMQWDKFSTDSEDALKKLETELLTALIDHINDRRYYTHAPITLEVKPDYFTSGVKLFASFDVEGQEEREVSLDVTMPNLKIDLPSELAVSAASPGLKVAIHYQVADKIIDRVLQMKPGKRFSVGRTKENDLFIDDASVSKLHASLMLNESGQLVVADTGSTNGTFIDGERIAYGKAITFSPGQKLRFGTVEIAMEVLEEIPAEVPTADAPEPIEDEVYKIGDFEFAAKTGERDQTDEGPAPTAPWVPIPANTILMPLNVEPSPVEKQNGVEGAEKELSKEK